MTADIIRLNVETTLDIPPDHILEAAKGKLSQVIVLGYTTEDDEYFAASFSSRPELCWLLDRLKRELLKAGEEDG